MAKKKKMKKVEKEIPTPSPATKGVPTHLHMDMERTITALDLAIVKQSERIDRLVNVLSKGNKNFKDI